MARLRANHDTLAQAVVANTPADQQGGAVPAVVEPSKGQAEALRAKAQGDSDRSDQQPSQDHGGKDGSLH